MRILIPISLIILLVSLITSCDPYYTCLIVNDTDNEVKVKISPPIEDFFAFDTRNAILRYRVELKDSFAVYLLPKDKEISVFGSLGVIPKEDDFPLVFIELYSNDTVKFNTKKEIIAAFERTKNRVYKLRVSSMIR